MHFKYHIHWVRKNSILLSIIVITSTFLLFSPWQPSAFHCVRSVARHRHVAPKKALSNSHAFKSVWIRVTYRSDKILSQRRRFSHVSRGDLFHQPVAATCRIVCLGLYNYMVKWNSLTSRYNTKANIWTPVQLGWPVRDLESIKKQCTRLK